jgi:integration host factor subunit beta
MPKIEHRATPDGGAGTLTKADLIAEVAATTGLLKKDADIVVNAALETMAEALRSGSQIEIRRFGSFRLRDRPARIGRNPRTGEPVQVPAKRVCYFKPGKTLKRIVGGPE